MARHQALFRPSLALLGIASLSVSLACSGLGSGCSALEPIPTGRYIGLKTDNAINARVSANGITYLNQNWKTLLEAFAPGQKLNFPLPCSKQTVPVIGGVTIADQGSAGCQSQSCGRLDDECTSKDAPALIDVTVNAFKLTPKPPSSVEGTVSLTIATPIIYVKKGWVQCGVDFDSVRKSPGTNSMQATVKFTIDTKWDKLLQFDVLSPITGVQVCEANGAIAPPMCLDPSDIDLSNQCDSLSSCSASWVCTAGNWDPIKKFILEMMSPTLEKRVEEAVAQQSCETCGAGKPPCPDIGNAKSTCKNGICVDDANGQCVPRFLGVEGRLSPGLVLSNFGVPPEAQLDVSVAAGSSVKVDTGINIGTRAGLTAVEVADCVPAIPAPSVPAIAPPNFDGEAPIDPATNKPSSYHVGIGISKPYLDLAMHHAHQSGSLCLNMSSSTVGVLNTGLFKTFLPSLGKLTTRDGKDAPMMVVLRPATVPQLTIGPGTYDAVSKKPIKPLLKLDMKDLTVDFYAMMDERFVRLFSLTADVSLPLSVIFEGCSSVTPALGDLKQLITNIRTANSEILAEDPKVLADLIPAIIGLAEPAVAGALKPFSLPDLGAFKLKISDTKGLTAISGTETYNHLGIFAQLMGATAMCSTGAPKTLATLKHSVMPAAEEMRLSGRPLPWPVAVLEVSALGPAGTAEFAWRVDGGMWTTFLAPNAMGELEVSHPAFLLQGKHTIEVRSRLAEDPHGISTPVAVPFTVDWEPPTVTLTADRERNVLEVRAHDAVTSADELQFAYVLGTETGEPAFGPSRVIDLAAVEAQGGVVVRVMDAHGNVGRQVWRVPTIAERPDGAPGSISGAASEEAVGCSATGGSGLLGLWSVLASVGWLWRRRRARSH